MACKEVDILKEGIMKNNCIGKEYTIKEAIESIDECHNRAVVVVDETDKVLGILSQGDVIRALISGKSLLSQVQTIIHPNFFYQNTKDLESAYCLFKKYHISLLPIVDDDFHLIDLIDLNDIYEYMEGK